jgi:hypothetical protein
MRDSGSSWRVESAFPHDERYGAMQRCFDDVKIEREVKAAHENLEH